MFFLSKIKTIYDNIFSIQFHPQFKEVQTLEISILTQTCSHANNINLNIKIKEYTTLLLQILMYTILFNHT